MKDQAKVQIAEKLAAEISPIIASAISSGDVTFVGLTVVVDNKYSATFPFHFVTETEEGEDRTKADEEIAKATLLAAVEYARAAGALKTKSIQILEQMFN